VTLLSRHNKILQKIAFRAAGREKRTNNINRLGFFGMCLSPVPSEEEDLKKRKKKEKDFLRDVYTFHVQSKRGGP